MEIKKHFLSECTFGQTQVTVSCHSIANEENIWTWVEDESTSTPSPTSTAATAETHTESCVATRLAIGTTIHARPFQRDSNHKDWDDRYFHKFCKLPSLADGSSTAAGGGLVITLESRARECIAVALSPQPDFLMGKTYVVHFGALGNTCTVIRRRNSTQNDANAVTFPTPPRSCCSEEKFLSYWILFTHQGYLTVGVGKVPGQYAIGTMDDSVYYTQLRTGMDVIQYVGVGNSAMGRHAQDLQVRNLRIMYIPSLFRQMQTMMERSTKSIQNQYIQTGGIPITEWMNGMQEESLNLSLLHPDCHHHQETSTSIHEIPEQHRDSVVMDREEEQLLWAEYQKECIKAKARAKKFNVEYTMPSPNVFFKYSQAKRMKANPQKGFVTGIDITSPEEQEKAIKRMQRFQQTTTAATTHTLLSSSSQLKRKQEEEEENIVEVNESTFQGPSKNNTTAKTLGNLGEYESDVILPVEQAWDNQNLLQGMRMDLPTYLYPNVLLDKMIGGSKVEEEEQEEGKILPEKLHLFAIDWAAFKQIRTDDILAHFSDYGPSYVEWLGELSCNVHFEDRYSASRALLAISQVLPTPPPSSLISSLNDDENFYEDAQAISDSIHPDKEESPLTTQAPDLGMMGWRFCKHPIRKTVHDRFGRVGTRARFLIRLASNFDVLDAKPLQRLRPPPGFSATRILGPGSDFPKRRRRAESMKEGGEASGRNVSKKPRMMRANDDGNGEPLGLSRSLKAPRTSI